MVDRSLPAYPVPFIGRVKELTQITALLDDSACRLLTLVGPGGMGKTRLAIEAASLFQDIYPHGIYFVSLQSLNNADFIVSKIAGVVGVQFSPGGNPRQQLLDFFREKSLLLVLDNFEHLLDDADLISQILATAPGVKALVTSRQRLNLLEEWVLEVTGLSFPQDANASPSLDYEALQLFMQTARRAHVSFELTKAQIKVVTRICQLVEGMPLGIELAAAWVRTLSCEAIADEIAHSLDILETPSRNIESRHATMRSTVQPTWERLSGIEQDSFKKLSVFRGGFTREAAEYVAGATLRILASLVDKSLLRLTASGRYEIHELLRQYSAERLNESPTDAEQTYDRHCDYYAHFMQNQWIRLTGNEIKSAIQEINLELDNARAAWDWAVNQHRAEAIDAMLDSLWFFYDTDSRSHEGEQVFANAVSKLKTLVPEQVGLWAKVLARQGALCRNALLLDKSYALLTQSVSLLRLNRELADLAFALARLQGVIPEGESARIIELEESLSIYTELNNQWGMGEALNWLSFLYLEDYFHQGSQESLELAQRYAQGELAVSEQVSNPSSIARACLNLGKTAYCLNEYYQAHEYFQKSLNIFEDIGIYWGIANSLWHLGYCACALGNYADARRFSLKGLKIAPDFQVTSNLQYIYPHLIVVAEIWLSEGQLERAYELFGFSDQWRRQVGYSKNYIEFRPLALLDEELSPDLTAAVERGRTRDFGSILKEVLDDLNEVEKPLLPPFMESLTEREIEILRLMTEGLNSREVAERLQLGVSTIRWYLKEVYNKLGVHSRSEALARAKELKLLR